MQSAGIHRRPHDLGGDVSAEFRQPHGLVEREELVRSDLVEVRDTQVHLRDDELVHLLSVVRIIARRGSQVGLPIRKRGLN
ncbi:hypothetical protein [Antarcticirhabdus aurantiaca]|uniref:hypothetical protein n=1 Tax=Antarcticirhabdus aurantiaca TaxID=2606717 RepID=UPI00131B95E3|nr:hypothetical protein [Antarcticirhabdus aurantiaca]